jgi:hypothetical protein
LLATQTFRFDQLRAELRGHAAGLGKDSA